MKNYWFSGDTHYSHNNILYLCGRPFNDIYDHDRILIENHNRLVSNEDDYYFLGDFAYKCSKERVFNLLKSLNGKIIILLGNHDKVLRKALQLGILDKEIKDEKIEIIGGKESIFDSSLSLSKMLKFDDQLIYISHYGHRTWPSAFRGSWHLYAHSHGNLPSLYKSMDVGVDTKTETHKRFHPWKLEEIKEKMSSVTLDFTEKPI